MPADIRNFRPEDHAPATELWESAEGVELGDADSFESVSRFLERNPALSFVAVDGDVLAATVLCGHDGRRGLIHHLVVSSDYRHQGLGRALVRRALDGLREAGIDKCHVLVFRHNVMARAFWQGVDAEERMTLVTFSLGTDPPEPDEPSAPGD